MQPSEEVGRIMMGNMSVKADVGSDMSRGTPIKTSNKILIGLDEKDVDKALKDYEGNPVRAPRCIEVGGSVLVQLSIYDGKIVGIL